MQRTAHGHWLLTRIEVRRTCDAEVADWEYVLVVLVFYGSFEEADGLLQKLYSHLDTLAAQFNDAGKNGQRLIFFDVATTV